MTQTREWQERLAQLQVLPGLDELPSDALLDEDLTALFLGVSPKSLANRRSGRRGLPYVKVGRSVRYRVDDVRTALKASAP